MANFTLPTVVALGTPKGHGALHIIRISGSKAFDLINKVCLYHVDQVNFKAQLNYIIDHHQKVIDQVIILKFVAPTTWTGEDMIEINCHGNMLIVQLIIDQLIKHGAELAGRGEFAKRAFLNGKIDLNQANAILDLVEAKNYQQVYAAAYNLQGKLSEQILDFRTKVFQILAEIELNIDYPEEHDLVLLDQFNQQLLVNTKAVLIPMQQLLNQSQNQKTNNWKIVLVGRTNAGKSSLLNAILNYDRAIVSNIAGTTRDTVEADHYLHGHLITIVDTAGIHDSDDQIEQMGIAKSLAAIKQADLIIHLIDVTQLNHPEDQVIHDLIKDHQYLTVYSKKDQLSAPLPKLPILISAQENDLDQLMEHLKLIVDQNNTVSSQFGLINQTGINDLFLAVDELQLAITGLKSGIVIDLLAEHYRAAYDHLSKILGLGDRELALEIFDNFCVGK